jgi:hypothetical protein
MRAVAKIFAQDTSRRVLKTLGKFPAILELILPKFPALENGVPPGATI